MAQPQDDKGYASLPMTATDDRELARSVLAALADPVFVVDDEDVIRYLNQAAADLIGHRAGDVLGDRWPSHFTLLDAEHQAVGLDAPAPEEGFWYVATGDGEDKPVVLSVSRAPLADGRGVTTIVLRPVRRLHGLVHRLAYQAAHDPLTDLVNRTVFMQRLEHLRCRVAEHAESHALLYLDLDRFKQINDSCGHHAGDEMLRQIADRLGANLRSRDSLARLGGDEFGLLLEHCDLDRAEQIAHELRSSVSTAPLGWRGRQFDLGVSVGLVPVEGNAATAESILRQADTACYMAKQNGVGVQRLVEYVADDPATLDRVLGRPAPGSMPRTVRRPGWCEDARHPGVSAYYRALERGFVWDHEPEDSFEAERLVSLIYEG